MRRAGGHPTRDLTITDTLQEKCGSVVPAMYSIGQCIMVYQRVVLASPARPSRVSSDGGDTRFERTLVSHDNFIRLPRCRNTGWIAFEPFPPGQTLCGGRYSATSADAYAGVLNNCSVICG